MCCPWVFTDVIHPPHLSKDGTIAHRVAYCGEPGCDVAQDSYCVWIGCWVDRKVHVNVENDSSYSNDVVQVGTGETD